MGFKIAVHPDNKYGFRYADHGDIRLYLGFKQYEKLPLDFSGEVVVPVVGGGSTLLTCTKGNPSTTGWRGKRSTHRCYVSCPTCSAQVPAGRTTQHKCKGI